MKLAVEDAAQDADDAAARQAHEAAEAKRKAEFDAKQAEKKAKRQAELDRIKAMNDAELLEAAVGRVAADTERLTRRNMKEAVAEYIQAKCREDSAFAVLVLDSERNMAGCFAYINRQAQKYAEQEMEDNGIERKGNVTFGLDIADGLVYEWAENYFREENQEDEEKFVPKPYIPPARKKGQGKTSRKQSGTAKPRTDEPEDTGVEQLTLGVM